MSGGAGKRDLPHPEELREARRLEGWDRALRVPPPFETAATRPPQGEENDKGIK